MLVARALALPPDPPMLARRLVAARARGVALLHTADRGAMGLPRAGRWSFVAAEPDGLSRALDPVTGDPAPLAEGPLAFVPRWIGVIPYEGRRAQLERPVWVGADARAPVRLVEPFWYRYPAVVCVDHETGLASVAGVHEASIDRLVALLEASPDGAPALAIDVADEEPPALHAARVAAAKELIAKGDLYQVNVARRLAIRVRSGDPLALYVSLARHAPSAFGACLHLEGDVAVVSTSPELLLHAESAASSRGFGALFTAPIKGTRPRGRDAEEDAALARDLDRDPKELAELTMIVDVERNDLGRVAEVGSVRVAAGPMVVTHPTVHHRLALLEARARADASREEVLAALVPSGSVTGAPKVRAMEVIAQLEASRRGLYTGGLGFVAHDGSVTLAMAIRTAVLEGARGDYWTGGGIVADSDPAREVEETRWKALQLARAAAG